MFFYPLLAVRPLINDIKIYQAMRVGRASKIRIRLCSYFLRGWGRAKKFKFVMRGKTRINEIIYALFCWKTHMNMLALHERGRKIHDKWWIILIEQALSQYGLTLQRKQEFLLWLLWNWVFMRCIMGRS
jgi:hypothetical protein